MRKMGHLGLALLCLGVMSCGGSSSSSTVSISVTVSGLAGNVVVLQDNGGDDLGVTANGMYTFAKPLAPGDAYAVTVKAQPQAPAQMCVVTGGTGTAGHDPVDVAVTC